jgi:molybdenum cofactor sulfurtransferase
MATNKSTVDYCNVGTEFDRHATRPNRNYNGILRSEMRTVYTRASTFWAGNVSSEASVSQIVLPPSITAMGILVLLLLGTCIIGFFERVTSSSENSGQRRSWWWFRPPATIKKSNGSHVGNDSESSPKIKRKMEFLLRVGDDYGYRGSDLGYIDDWRPIEFPSLQLPFECSEHLKNCGKDDNEGNAGTVEQEVYLDYAGAALPMKSQLERIYRDATRSVLGNPHSTGPAASRTAERIQSAESRVLSHLGAGPGRYASLQLPETFYQSSSQTASASYKQNMDRHPGYDVHFTSGSTEAFKTIAERFPWRPSSCNTRCHGQCRYQHHRSIFMYVTNSHNSVVGMRQLAIQKGATFYCLDLKDLQRMTTVKDWKDLEDEVLTLSSLDNDDNEKKTVGVCSECQNKTTPASRHLLVFPSECNFGGDRPDAKSIIKVARASGWYTMLDVAKHASTDHISLKLLNPDFAALSFYKLFGEPTGVGALLVRRSAISVLFEADDSRRQYQGGGSVDIMLPNRDYTVPKGRSIGLASFQNGTSHFRGIANLTHGFDSLERVGGMSAIHRHASCLANEMSSLLRRMKHNNGIPVIRLYGAWGSETRIVGGEDDYDDQNPTRGPIVALNVFRSDGTAVGYNEVSKLASLNRPPIQFRTGCFCNPGACQRALNLDDRQAIDNYEKTGHVCGDHIDLANGMPTGAIRVSFGKDSIWEDMEAFVRFIEVTFKDNCSSDLDKSTTTSTTSLRIDAKVDADKDKSNSMTRVSVSELYLFPIKSCAAQRISKWPLYLPSGKLKYDREFAIVNTSGVALRMQTCSKLGLISPVIDLETETMRVSALGCKDLVIRLSDDLYHGGENVVHVCGDKCGGRVWGDAFVSEWFSSFLGVQCWLARYSLPKTENNTEGSMSASLSRPSFSNEQPILLVSENAVATLNKVLQSQRQPPCAAKRFRPNIVIKDIFDTKQRHGDQSHHIEDEWKTISLPSGRLKFSVEGGCPRCTMVDYDPTTGQKGKTLRALASYRRRNGHIVFGIFLRAMAVAQHSSKKKMRQHHGNANNEQDLSQNDIVFIREGDILECK